MTNKENGKLEENNEIATTVTRNSVNSRQVGGTHYFTGDNSVQHWDIIENNHMGYLEGNATKYIIRWEKKNGVQDLEKVMHYTQKILSEYLERGRDNPAKPSTDKEYNFNSFCVANEIPFPENMICAGLLNWKDQDDLIQVMMYTARLQGAATPVLVDRCKTQAKKNRKK